MQAGSSHVGWVEGAVPRATIALARDTSEGMTSLALPWMKTSARSSPLRSLFTTTSLPKGRTLTRPGIVLAGATSRDVPHTTVTGAARTFRAARARAPVGSGSPKSTTSAFRMPPQQSEDGEEGGGTQCVGTKRPEMEAACVPSPRMRDGSWTGSGWTPRRGETNGADCQIGHAHRTQATIGGEIGGGAKEEEG